MLGELNEHAHGNINVGASSNHKENQNLMACRYGKSAADSYEASGSYHAILVNPVSIGVGTGFALCMPDLSSTD